MKRSKAFITPLINEAAGFTLIMLIWGAASLFYPPYIIPSPWDVLGSVKTFLPQDFMLHLNITLYRIFAGFTISLLLGTILGVLAHLKGWSAPMNSLMLALQVLPGMVLGVIFLLMFGLGSATPILLIATLTLPTLALNTMNGLAKTDKALQELLVTLHARRSVTFTHIILPALIPVLQSNFSLGIGLAAKVVVMGEFIGAQDGLGYLLNAARITFDMKEVFFYLIVLLLFTLLLQALQSLFSSLFLKKYFYPE
ncbi:MAG TPA: ABC transporter permease subunit [Anaerolineaceae bacterium]|nr:ABC transporter permease subunit [Anaerolineaceae bacterium]HPN53972.1 ABC transporter permease subunit [Anaerolineaceae bacterium]